MSPESRNDFERAASAGRGTGIVAEFWHFIKQNKKWWLAPTIVVLLLVSMLLVLGGTAVAPFIYTLF